MQGVDAGFVCPAVGVDALTGVTGVDSLVGGDDRGVQRGLTYFGSAEHDTDGCGFGRP